MPVSGTPLDYMDIYCSAWEDNPDRRPTIKMIIDLLENVALEPIFQDTKLTPNSCMSYMSWDTNGSFDFSQTSMGSSDYLKFFGRKSQETSVNSCNSRFSKMSIDCDIEQEPILTSNESTSGITLEDLRER
ncbi:7143_t:CDS:2, partial [Acaulospora colombiana]